MSTEDDSELAQQAQLSRASAPTDVSPITTPPDPPTNSTSHQPPQSGSRLVGSILDGRYFVERELGQGGVGIVYLALDRKLLDKRVVVKVLLEQSLRSQKIVQKFQQEKEALTRVDHPGLIGILDTGELSDGKPYIIMQYVSGATLRSAMCPEGMPLERAANIVRQIGSALAAAHEKGILHRDLKPENIMLQPLSSTEEQVRIIDFGVAKIKNSLIAFSTMTPTTLGTFGYMSPEQFRGERVDATSDIYSVGVISYEMVTGRRPFNPETVGHLAEIQREGVRVKPKDLRPALPQEAQDLILRALLFNPNDRPQNAHEFGATLALALLNEPQPLDLSAQSPIPDRPFDPAANIPTRPLDRPPRFSLSLNTQWLKLAISLVFLAVFTTALFGSYMTLSWKSLVNSSPNSGPQPIKGPVGLNANTTANNNSSASGKSSLRYWLTVQKIRDGQPYQAPFKSSGQEIFESGYKFRLNALSPQKGFLYVVNEGSADNGAMNLTLIYPTPVSGSANLRAGESIQTGWNVFQGQPGTEQFWIVWSVSPIGELEAAREAAFKTANGALTDAVLVRTVREFLMENGARKPVVVKDTVKRETLIEGSGDLLVNLLELEHR